MARALSKVQLSALTAGVRMTGTSCGRDASQPINDRELFLGKMCAAFLACDGSGLMKGLSHAHRLRLFSAATAVPIMASYSAVKAAILVKVVLNGNGRKWPCDQGITAISASSHFPPSQPFPPARLMKAN
jgi:hypothetical protein